MPAPTVTERLRVRLRQLLKTRGYGAAAQLAAYSQTRTGSRISTQELSYFLRNTKGRRGLQLDDLDDIADFFRITIGELLGDTKLGDLTQPEQRIVLSFRTLPPATQEHFIAIMEAAALGAHLASTRAHSTRIPAATRRRIPDADSPELRLPSVRAIIERFMDDLAAIQAPANTERQNPASGR